MKARLYVESSVISYLAARPSRDAITAARQLITRNWWKTQRARFELVASQLVLSEISKGDPEAAARRREILTGLDFLDVTKASQQLASRLVDSGPLPVQARVDAEHVAVASVHGVAFLLTWNCKHIANAEMRPAIEAMCKSEGYRVPILCTPEELFQ